MIEKNSGLDFRGEEIMRIVTLERTIDTRGFSDIVDITALIEEELKKSNLKEGQVLIFTAGSTAGVSTIEYEPNLIKDIKEALEKIAPQEKEYHHHLTWGDDNGSSHVRSTFLKTSLIVPFKEGRLLLGTWQQIVILDFDTRPRRRRFIIQFIGK